MKSLTPIETWYDTVIKSQADFEAWYKLLDNNSYTGESVLFLAGKYTRSDGKGLHLPSTLKQIYGIGDVLITISNFKRTSGSNEAGIWYTTTPTTKEYSIENISLSCTGSSSSSSSGYGFSYCTNLINCTGTGTGSGTDYGIGFHSCTNLTNCTGTGIGSAGYGFDSCTNLTNCTGTGTGSSSTGYGFYSCTNLTNCTGTGTGTKGYGFGSCKICSNCRQDPTMASTTTTWGGTNTDVDLYTCPEYPTKPPATISSIIVTRV